MKGKIIKVKGENDGGQHQDASPIDTRVTRSQTAALNNQAMQNREVLVPASTRQHEENPVKIWREYCSDHSFLCRWQISDQMDHFVEKFDFSAPVGPSIPPGDAIILITEMMTAAGFNAWYPFDPQEYDSSISRVSFMEVIEEVWLALALIINKPDGDSTPDYKTPIKQREISTEAKREFWARTAMAWKKEAEKKPVQAYAIKREDLTPMAQKLRFNETKESSPYSFQTMETLRELKEQERIKQSLQRFTKEEDLDSLFELDTGEVRHAGGQALQIQTISNWEPKHFSNKDHSGAKAREWLKRFNMYVEMANLGKIQKCQMFEMYARGEVLDWYRQLMPGIKKDWTLLAKFFASQFCEDEQSSMKKYYSAKQTEEQTPQQYYWKLNSLGKKAGRKLIGDIDNKHVEEHIKHYLDTL